MSRPVFIGEAEDLAQAVAGSQIVVGGDEARHARKVRRLRAGEPVEVVDGNGTRAIGTVLDSPAEELRVGVQDVQREGTPDPEVTVVQALAKADRGELAVELLTEVGADRIVPWSAQRCVTRWDGQRQERGLQRWRSRARESSKQARRARFPEVTKLHTSDDVVGLIRNARLALVLHEAAALRLAATTMPDTGEILLIVGPEGGISDEELASFTNAGALAVRLGASVLRTSSAGAVAAAVAMAGGGRWD